MKAQQRREHDAENHLGEGDTGAEGEPLGVALSLPHTYAKSALNAEKAHATAQRTFLARGSHRFIESLGHEALSSQEP